DHRTAAASLEALHLRNSAADQGRCPAVRRFGRISVGPLTSAHRSRSATTPVISARSGHSTATGSSVGRSTLNPRRSHHPKTFRPPASRTGARYAASWPSAAPPWPIPSGGGPANEPERTLSRFGHVAVGTRRWGCAGR